MWIEHYDDSKISYDGEIRLEIFDLDGNPYLPHAEEEVDGILEKNDEDARRHLGIRVPMVAPRVYLGGTV